MDNRKLCKLLLVVLTLHFVRSHAMSIQKDSDVSCFQDIQNDATFIINPYLKEEYNRSCRNQIQIRKNFKCILNWASAGNCAVFKKIQEKIRRSIEKCDKGPAPKPPTHCSENSFLKCWCGFLIARI